MLVGYFITVFSLFGSVCCGKPPGENGKVSSRDEESPFDSKTKSSNGVYEKKAAAKRDRESEVLRLPLKASDLNYYYDLDIGVHGSPISIRLDIVQPEIWVMDDSVMECEEIDDWFSSEYARYSSIPDDATTATEYQATLCVDGGKYSYQTNMPRASPEGIYNGQRHTIPYIDSLNVSGQFATDDIQINISHDVALEFPNFTFVAVNDATVDMGSLGLAGNPSGSGFLDALVDQGFIESPGYSLWLNDYNRKVERYGELLPGIVDRDYFDGTLYAFDMLSHETNKYSDDRVRDDANSLALPIVLLEDLLIDNGKTGRTVSLMNPNESTPVLLDSRTTLSYLPMDTMIEIAIQFNAYYSQEAYTWLVQCETVDHVNATLDFVFGDLKVKIPISSFIEPIDTDSPLKFPNGNTACFLRFFPSDIRGYSSLGIPFLTWVYMAIDNEGGTIALANKKNVTSRIENKTDAISSTITEGSIESEATSRGSSNNIGYITSGYIPFASYVNSSSVGTLSQKNFGAEDYGTGIKAFPRAVISDNQIVVRQSDSQVTNLFTGFRGSNGRATTTSGNSGNRLSLVTNQKSKHSRDMLDIFSLLMGSFSFVTILLLI